MDLIAKAIITPTKIILTFLSAYPMTINIGLITMYAQTSYAGA